MIIIQNSQTDLSGCKAPPVIVSGTIMRLPGKWVHDGNFPFHLTKQIYLKLSPGNKRFQAAFITTTLGTN